MSLSIGTLVEHIDFGPGKVTEILGSMAIVDFFGEVTVIYVPEGEIRHYDPLLRSLINVNTEDDLHDVRKLIAQDPLINPG